MHEGRAIRSSQGGERRYPARGCPICRSTRSRLLFRQTFEKLSDKQILDGYDVTICDECGAGYADDIPLQSAFDDYYRDLSKYDYGDRSGNQPPAAEQRLQEVAATIAPYIPERQTRVFEIGCASGHLLKVLNELGFQNLLGSDPSPGCVTAARELYGVRAIVGTIFDVPKDRYDFLILTGVMEHIRVVNHAALTFHSLLAESGRVYLEVPDASRYVARLDAPFQEFSTEHINFFSAQSLTNLMCLNGFRCIGTGHAVRMSNEVTCPTVYGVYEKSDQCGSVVRDVETEPGLHAYIEGCSAEDERVRRIIDRCLAPSERMIVWGVGTHTLRLLATGGLDPDRIALFVDSSPKYQDAKLRGIPVVSPAVLQDRPEPILISSRGFQREIHDQIRNQLGMSNRVILLYDEAKPTDPN